MSAGQQKKLIDDARGQLEALAQAAEAKAKRLSAQRHPDKASEAKAVKDCTAQLAIAARLRFALRGLEKEKGQLIWLRAHLAIGKQISHFSKDPMRSASRALGLVEIGPHLASGLRELMDSALLDMREANDPARTAAQKAVARAIEEGEDPAKDPEASWVDPVESALVLMYQVQAEQSLREVPEAQLLALPVALERITGLNKDELMGVRMQRAGELHDSQKFERLFMTSAEREEMDERARFHEAPSLDPAAQPYFKALSNAFKTAREGRQIADLSATREGRALLLQAKQALSSADPKTRERGQAMLTVWSTALRQADFEAIFDGVPSAILRGLTLPTGPQSLACAAVLKRREEAIGQGLKKSLEAIEQSPRHASGVLKDPDGVREKLELVAHSLRACESNMDLKEEQVRGWTRELHFALRLGDPAYSRAGNRLAAEHASRLYAPDARNTKLPLRLRFHDSVGALVAAGANPASVRARYDAALEAAGSLLDAGGTAKTTPAAKRDKVVQELIKAFEDGEIRHEAGIVAFGKVQLQELLAHLPSDAVDAIGKDYVLHTRPPERATQGEYAGIAARALSTGRAFLASAGRLRDALKADEPASALRAMAAAAADLGAFIHQLDVPSMPADEPALLIKAGVEEAWGDVQDAVDGFMKTLDVQALSHQQLQSARAAIATLPVSGEAVARLDAEIRKRSDQLIARRHQLLDELTGALAAHDLKSVFNALEAGASNEAELVALTVATTGEADLKGKAADKHREALDQAAATARDRLLSPAMQDGPAMALPNLVAGLERAVLELNGKGYLQQALSLSARAEDLRAMGRGLKVEIPYVSAEPASKTAGLQALAEVLGDRGIQASGLVVRVVSGPAPDQLRDGIARTLADINEDATSTIRDMTLDDAVEALSWRHVKWRSADGTVHELVQPAPTNGETDQEKRDRIEPGVQRLIALIGDNDALLSSLLRLSSAGANAFQTNMAGPASFVETADGWRGLPDGLVETAYIVDVNASGGATVAFSGKVVGSTRLRDSATGLSIDHPDAFASLDYTVTLSAQGRLALDQVPVIAIS